MKELKINFNVNNNEMYDDNGKVLTGNTAPKLYYAQQIMLNIQLVTDNSLTPYVGLENDFRFIASIDTDYNTATLPMVSTLSGEFNLENEWDGGLETAQPISGQLSFPIYGGQIEFKEKMGTKLSITNSKLEILVIDSVNDFLYDIYQMPFICKNIIGEFN